MEFKAAIFDLDGVIVDTVPIHFKAWKEMFAEYGKEFTFEDYKQKVDGIPRIDGGRAILTDLSDEDIKKACDKKQGYFLEFIEKDEIPTHESTLRLIKELKSHSIKIANISSSRNCKRILKRINLIDELDAIVDGTEITKGKPDPQVFLMAAERLSAKPEDCIVFEDAVLGVEAAKRAKMLCVGIDRYNEPDRLKKADIVVSDLKELDYNKLRDLFS
ncbi:MAG: beta-phosphoglucomutase family hydrolase [Candidatus Omnitrophica bacterium]|nr:beta-phosphoglucomutase family hydrolase [Candidatus Omnitrophota bacterium]